MKVSYKWLKQYLDLNMPAKDLAEKIERTAVEVDSVTVAEDGLKKLVVGHILSMKKHPESDHLHICSVDVGEDEPLQIVCGAPNVDAGQKVIVLCLILALAVTSRSNVQRCGALNQKE